MRRFGRILLILVIVIVLALGGLTGYGVYTTRRMLPQITGKLVLQGLAGDVEIIRDEYGVPQIYANTPADLFSQGVIQCARPLVADGVQSPCGAGTHHRIDG